MLRLVRNKIVETPFIFSETIREERSVNPLCCGDTGYTLKSLLSKLVPFGQKGRSKTTHLERLADSVKKQMERFQRLEDTSGIVPGIADSFSSVLLSILMAITLLYRSNNKNTLTCTLSSLPHHGGSAKRSAGLVR